MGMRKGEIAMLSRDQGPVNESACLFPCQTTSAGEREIDYVKRETFYSLSFLLFVYKQSFASSHCRRHCLWARFYQPLTHSLFYSYSHSMYIFFIPSRLHTYLIYCTHTRVFFCCFFLLRMKKCAYLLSKRALPKIFKRPIVRQCWSDHFSPLYSKIVINIYDC